jgi:hypothetical protein
MQRVNDADTASEGNARNRLYELQVRIHPRLEVKEENLEQLRRLDDITIVSGDFVGGAERGHGVFQPPDALAMLVEIVRIGFAVALDVRQTALVGFGFGHH